MAFRRFRRFTPRRRFMRRRGTRSVTQTRRWEQCNVHFQDIVAFDNQAPTLLAVELMSNQLFGVDVASAAKRFEVGGFVWDSSHFLIDPGGALILESDLAVFEGLCTVRTDAAQLPTSIPDWTRATFPVGSTNREEDLPVRTHFRRHCRFPASGLHDNGTAISSGQSGGWSTKSLRLRAALDDDQILLYTWTYASFNVPSAAQAAVLTTLSGTLYWRLAF